MRLRKQWMAGYKNGVKAAANLVQQYDKQLSVGISGYRMSDVILCKFNLTRRKSPRKVEP